MIKHNDPSLSNVTLEKRVLLGMTADLLVLYANDNSCMPPADLMKPLLDAGYVFYDDQDRHDFHFVLKISAPIQKTAEALASAILDEVKGIVIDSDSVEYDIAIGECITPVVRTGETALDFSTINKAEAIRDALDELVAGVKA